MDRLAHLLQPLTTSSKELAGTSQNSAEKANFAMEKARLLLGQFRRGEANDPGMFITSIAAVLSRYSEAIVTEVTNPRGGLASKTDWLPTVKEVSEACETLANRAAAIQKSDAVCEETLARRTSDSPRVERPTLAELKEKYGPNWGITKADVDRAERRLSRDEAHAKILAEYARLGRDPVYAGDLLLSPSLVEKLLWNGPIGEAP